MKKSSLGFSPFSFTTLASGTSCILHCLTGVYCCIVCAGIYWLQARKAEFLLADAVENGCDCIVTFGGVHSNHARVMSLAARELGLDCILFIRTAVSPLPPAPRGYLT